MSVNAFTLFGEVEIGVSDFERKISDVDARLKSSAKEFERTGRASTAFGNDLNSVARGAINSFNQEISQTISRVPVVGGPLSALSQQLLYVNSSTGTAVVGIRSLHSELRQLESQAGRIKNRLSDFAEGTRIKFGGKVDTEFLTQFRSASSEAEKLSLLTAKFGDQAAKAFQPVENAAFQFAKLERDGGAALRVLETRAASAITKLAELETQAASSSGTLAAMGGPVGIAVAAVAILTTLTVGAGVAAFGMAQKFSEAGSEVYDLSNKLGLSTETVSGLRSQLQQSGTTLDSFSLAVFGLQKNINAAREGSKEQIALFKELGVTSTDTETALRQVLRGLAAIPDETTRNAKGAQAMGKGFKELAVFLSDTGGEIDPVIEKARALGLVMDRETARAADEFGDTLDVLKAQAGGVSNMFAREFAPAISQAMQDVSKYITENKGIVTDWGKSVSDVINGIRNIANNPIVIAVRFAFSSSGLDQVPSLALEVTGIPGILRGIRQIGAPGAGAALTPEQQIIQANQERAASGSTGGPTSTDTSNIPTSPGGKGAGKGGGGGGGESLAVRLARQELEGLKLNFKDFENFTTHKLSAERRSYEAGLEDVKTYSDARIKLESARYAKEKAVLLAEQAFINNPANKFKAGERELKQTDIQNQIAEAQRKHEDSESSIKAEGKQKRLELDRTYAEREISIMEAANRALESAQGDAVKKGLTTFVDAENVRFQKEQEVFAKRQELVNQDLARYEKGDQDKFKEAQQAARALANEEEAVLHEHNRRQDEARRQDLESAQNYSRALRSIYSDIASTNRETLSIQIRALEDNQLRRGEYIRLTTQLEKAAAAERSKAALAEMSDRRAVIQASIMDEREKAALIKAIDAQIIAQKRLSAAEQAEIERQAAEKSREVYREIASDLKGIFKNVFGSIGDGWRGLLNSMLNSLKSIFLNVAAELFENLVLQILDPQQAQKGSQAGGIVGAITNAILGIGKSKKGQSGQTGELDTTPVDLSKVALDAIKGSQAKASTEVVKGINSSTTSTNAAIDEQTTRLAAELRQLGEEICSCNQTPQEPGWAKWARLAVGIAGIGLSGVGSGDGGGGSEGGLPDPHPGAPTTPPVLLPPPGGFHAMGGLIMGSGNSTSDSIPAMLSNGEFVINAGSVKKFGLSFFEAVNQGVMPLHFSRGGYASRIPLHLVSGGSVDGAGSGGSAAAGGGGDNIYINMDIHGVEDVHTFRQSAQQIAQEAFEQALRARTRLS